MKDINLLIAEVSKGRQRSKANMMLKEKEVTRVRHPPDCTCVIHRAVRLVEEIEAERDRRSA